jgi:hypothetical protein
MNLRLNRQKFTAKSTIGSLWIDGAMECFTLEDVCREETPGTWFPAMKVPAQTAIPYGRYEVVLSVSARFKTLLPLLLKVPDFEGVRIHAGNSAADTEGCILVGAGVGPQPDWISQSLLAKERLMLKLREAAAAEKIWLDIVKE